MSHWYVWIDGKYHITRTNIAECQSIATQDNGRQWPQVDP